MTSPLPALPWPTLSRMLESSVETYASKVALIDGDTQLSYTVLGERVEAIARGIVAAGVEPGDRVSICLPNSWQWVACAFAIWRAGAVIAPINTRFKSGEFGHILELAEPKLVFICDEFLGNPLRKHFDTAAAALAHEGAVRPKAIDCATDGVEWQAFLSAGEAVDGQVLIDRVDAQKPDTLADIIFTSGTTGVPKGVMATHGQDVRAYRNLGLVEDMSERDVLGIVLPFFHTFGFKAGFVLSCMSGATTCIFNRLDPDRLISAIERHKITFLPGPPAIFHALLDHPRRDEYDLTSLRLAVVGSTFVPTALTRRMQKELHFDHIVSSYGLTEATGVGTQARIGDPEEVIVNTIGSPQLEVEVRIWNNDHLAAVDEVGEIQLRGYNITSGYYRNPEATKAAIGSDGWLSTGDLGAMRADGNVVFRGRLREMMIIGGFNVYPLEVENALRHNPAVAEVAVMGIPDDRLGETPAAFVVRAAGSDIDGEALHAWLTERIAGYKVPRSWRFLDALPVNASGKIVKDELRSLIENKSEN